VQVTRASFWYEFLVRLSWALDKTVLTCSGRWCELGFILTIIMSDDSKNDVVSA